jgi:phospholipid/cholesterol/gamma-HCH transport system substrate-binding protein
MKRVDDFIVGLTMLGGIVLVVGGVLWTKESSMGREERHVSARFHDVGSVRIGTPVVVRGMRSGKVDRIQLEDGFVVMRMALAPDVELPRQPVVLLNESNLFGEWQATITDREAIGRDEEIQRQLRETTRDDDVLAGASLPDLAKLTAVAGRIAGDVADVAERVDLAFDTEAAKELRRSIRNFSDLSSTLATAVRQQSGNLTRASSSVEGGVAALNQAALMFRDVSLRFDSATSKEQVQALVSDAGEAARQLRSATRQLSSMAEQLSRSQARLDAVLVASESIATRINAGQGSLGLLVNDPAFYRNTDSLVMELRALVADVKKNPRRYINLRIF